MKHEQALGFEQALRRGRGRLHALSATVPTAWLAGALVAFLGLNQLLLWRFLDASPIAAYGVGAIIACALCWGVSTSVRKHGRDSDPSLGTILFCVAAAFALLILGGEGRLFYANIDWQVRDAVLRDMSVNPWPFVYTARAEPDLLRAPIGMYLVPSLAFKALGPVAGDCAMLVQNALLLGTIFTLASTLFEGRAARLTALAVFIAFSGLDLLGAAATDRVTEHLDAWAGIEFSANLALAFWVPHHALAGWAAAACYMLWARGRQPLALLLAVLPLTALWSPLAMIGSLPFVLAAGLKTLARNQLRILDVLVGAGSALLSAPALLYLASGSSNVGAGSTSATAAQFVFFQAVETFPYLAPLAIVALIRRDHRITLATAAICLLAAPLVRIGASVDFTSRASIPALAIVAILTAHALSDRQVRRPIKLWLVIALCVGSVTAASELARAVSHPPSPRGSCTFFKAWDQSFSKYPKDSYLAPVSTLPVLLRPQAPHRVPAAEPERCWPGTWYHPL